MAATTQDPLVKAAVDNWAPRFVAQGVDHNDFATTTRRIAAWDRWLDEWETTAQVHLDLAREAEMSGHRLSAGEAYVRAALCLHFAKFLWFEDEGRHWTTTARARAALESAHRLLDPTAERIEIATASGTIVGNLRRPRGRDLAPVALLLPGLDSAKEEFFNWENVFLARGMATFSLDGPGQGETGRDTPIRHDYEVAASAAIDALRARDDIADRVGVVGVSLGGYYACRVAASDPRVEAAVAIGGPYDFGACWPGLPDLTRDAFRRHARSRDDDGARQAASRFTLDGVTGSIHVPLLVVFGKLDRLIPWQQAARVADEAQDAEFVLYEDGNHVCNNIPYKYRPLAGDWLSDRLRGGGG